jgi:hypothetical protein
MLLCPSQSQESQRGLKSMLTREQIHNMLLLRKYESNIFSTIPNDLIKVICGFGPNSDIAKALHHAAYARKEDVEALLALLDENPSLLLQSGNVKTPGGDEWNQVTIYEFLLGAGDYELAKLVQDYFAKIEGGEEERLRQYERYRPHIEGMLTQTPYDLSSLFELIKAAPPEEIKALLNNDLSGDTALCKAMIKFRKDWAPKILTEPGMHYNYASLQHALEIFVREWNILRASRYYLEKTQLVWQQLIGFEMRRFPGIDRCAIAEGLFSVVTSDAPLPRSYIFKRKSEVAEFPICDNDDSSFDLCGNYFISIFRGQACSYSVWGEKPDNSLNIWKMYVEQKLKIYITNAATTSPATNMCDFFG